MTARLVILTCAALLSAIPAIADETDDDVKCLAVSLNMSSSDNANDQSIGMLSTMFWMGKLDGRVPDADIEKRTLDAFGALKPDEVKTEQARCTETLTARGHTLTSLGQQLQEQQRQQDNAR